MNYLNVLEVLKMYEEQKKLEGEIWQLTQRKGKVNDVWKPIFDDVIDDLIKKRERIRNALSELNLT